MSSESLLWGILALASGIFVCAYGNVMFRFVLAVVGFMLGFSAVMWLGGGLQGGLLPVVAIVVGAILAAVFYGLFKLALYFAGGILGIVIVLVIVGLVGVGGSNLGIFSVILLIIGAVGGGFFGRRLGDMAIILATAMAGAYLIVLGLAKLFGAGIDGRDAVTMLGTAFPLVLFAAVALVSGLAQYEMLRVRRRFGRR